MTEQREQCCGTCRWWVKYRSREGGWCFRDVLDMLPSESCLGWESYRQGRAFIRDGDWIDWPVAKPDPIPDAGPTPADMRGEVDHD